MGKRGAGRRLSDQERMEILDTLARETKVKNVDLAKRYGVSEGAIRKLKQIKETVRDRYVMGNEHNRDKRKRGGFVRNAKFEQELYEWISRMRESQAYQLIPLTQTAVRQQAILLAKKYDTMATFKASPGWFARFCARHRLDPPAQPPSSLESDPNDITMAAVGDTVPGGPLASAYQVDATLTSSAIPTTVFVGHTMGAGINNASTIKIGDETLDLKCGEAVKQQVPVGGVAVAVISTTDAATILAAPAAVAATTAVPTVASVSTIPTKHEPAHSDTAETAAAVVVVPPTMPTEEDVFSLGL